MYSFSKVKSNTFTMESSTSGISSKTKFFSRQSLYDIIRNADSLQLNEKINILKEEIIKRTSPIDMKDFEVKFSTFISEFKKRWSKSNRHHERFSVQYKNWLHTSISFVNHSTNKRGRKELEFDECSIKTKTKKCKALRDYSSLSELSYATQLSLRASGQIEASKILKDVTSSPSRATLYKASLTSEEQVKQLSAEAALLVMVEAKLTRSQYEVIRKAAPDKFPSYKVVQQAKRCCYPKSESITVSETKAEIIMKNF